VVIEKELPMADVIYSVAVSLDGYVARSDLDLDWLGPFMTSGDDYTGRFIDSMEALIVGSRTYAESEQTMEWFGRGCPWLVPTSRSQTHRRSGSWPSWTNVALLEPAC
jgi:hypothetical protein